jgi:hypothetical protein
MKFGSLNLLEPSGPVQACNGIALLLSYYYYCYYYYGTRWRIWLRHYKPKVAGSIPNDVGIFNCHNPSDRTMALDLLSL